MSDFDPYHEQRLAIAELESLVLRAGSYVQPTDDLRPQVIEASREAVRQQRTNRRMGSLAVCAILLAMTGFPDFLLSSRLGTAVVHSTEVHQRAALSAVEPGIGTNWALYEVFKEIRQEQAELLNNSDD